MLSASFLVLIFLICWINVHFACSATAFWFLLPGFAGNMSISLDSYWFFGSCFLVSQEECPFLLLLTGFLVPTSWFRRENVHFSGQATAFWILFSGFAGRMSISLARLRFFGSYFLVSPGECPFLWLNASFLVPAPWFRRENVHFSGSATAFWFLLPDFAGRMSISLASYWFFGSYFLISPGICPFRWLLTGFLLAFWILLSDFAGKMSISLASYWFFGSDFLISPVKCPFLWLLTGFLDPTSWFRPKNVHFARQATDFHKLFGSCFLIFRKKIHSGFTEKMSTSLARPTYQPVQRSLNSRCTGSRKKREELRNCTEIFSSVIRLCSLFCNSLM